MQFTYGIATSTEVAYYTYIYAQVHPSHYQKVTSFTRVALLLGRFLSGVLAQSLTSAGLLDYKQLNYLTLSSVTLASAVSFFLPRVDRTIYFHRVSTVEEEEILPDRQLTWNAAMKRVQRDFVGAFKDKYVLKWSVWWALGMCGNFQVGNYVQPLWETIAPVNEDNHIYNGAVEASTTLLSKNWDFCFQSKSVQFVYDLRSARSLRLLIIPDFRKCLHSI